MKHFGNTGEIPLVIERIQEFNDKEVEDYFIGKNEWTLSASITSSTDNEDYLGVIVRCNEKSRSNLWSCTADIKVSLMKLDGDEEHPDSAPFSREFSKRFMTRDFQLEFPQFISWENLMKKSNQFVKNNKVELRAEIKVKANTGRQLFVEETFDKPKDKLTDMILLVEEKKVYVGRQSLAMHSRFFHTLFYSNFEESKKDEIRLEDVKHSEFVDLLNFVYPSHKELDLSNVSHVLSLADRFEFWRVVEKAEQFLIKTKELHIVHKLWYAENFKLADLQDDCFYKIETKQEILDLRDHEWYNQLGDISLSLLFIKMTEMEDQEAKLRAERVVVE